MQKKMKMGGMGEDVMSFEADDDGEGNPRMPWEDSQKSLADLAAKYGGSKSAGAAA